MYAIRNDKVFYYTLYSGMTVIEIEITLSIIEASL